MEHPRLPYYSTNLSREVENPERADYAEILEILHSDQLRTLVDDGLVTLAMIKPNVGPEANNMALDDLAAADEIETRIGELGVMAKFSFTFDAEGADVFYDGPAKTDSMMPKPPLKSDTFENRWEEYKDLMQSGPATILLLYGVNAIEKWRQHLGHWNIVANHDPATIRGAMGVDNHNNLVHGSDSPESVKREIAIIADQISRY